MGSEMCIRDSHRSVNDPTSTSFAHKDSRVGATLSPTGAACLWRRCHSPTTCAAWSCHGAVADGSCSATRLAPSCVSASCMSTTDAPLAAAAVGWSATGAVDSRRDSCTEEHRLSTNSWRIIELSAVTHPLGAHALPRSVSIRSIAASYCSSSKQSDTSCSSSAACGMRTCGVFLHACHNDSRDVRSAMCVATDQGPFTRLRGRHRLRRLSRRGVLSLTKRERYPRAACRSTVSCRQLPRRAHQPYPGAWCVE